MLLVARVVGQGLAHHQQDLAAGAHDPGDPPLASVDHVVVAVAHDRGLDVGRIGGGDLGLGHHVGRADLAVEQRLQPALLLLRRAVAGEHLSLIHI